MSTEPATGRHEVTVSELQQRTAADGAPPAPAGPWEPAEPPEPETPVETMDTLAAADTGAAARREEHRRWEDRSRVVLTPIAAPSILGLFAFAASTFMVASNLAGWWGDPVTAPVIIAPFAFFFGGLGQLLAGMWAYRARDGVATAMHGTWGAFWLGWGLLVLLVTVGVLPPAVLTSQAFGFWFIGLTVITAFGAVAASFVNYALTATLTFLTVGAAFLAAGLVGGVDGLVVVGGWVLVASALAAFYTAGAMMLAQAAGGRVVLPLGARGAGADTPGTRIAEPIEYARGMPGAKVGQ